MIVADLQVGVRAKQYPLDHPWEVPQVKDIMGLGRSWQEILHCSFINCHSSLYQHLSISLEKEEGRLVKKKPELKTSGQYPEDRGASYLKNITSKPLPKCQSVIELKILVKMSSWKALMETIFRWRVNRPGKHAHMWMYTHSHLPPGPTDPGIWESWLSLCLNVLQLCCPTGDYWNLINIK